MIVMPPKWALGFVYLVEVGSKRYIGCKRLLSHTTRPPLKGKKVKRKITKPSNWLTYCGSSKKLLEHIKRGADVRRTILYWASSKSELSYVELRLQMYVDALRSPIYYNGILNVRLPVLKLKDNYEEAYRHAQKYLDNYRY